MAIFVALALPASAWADTDYSTSTTTYDDDTGSGAGFGLHASTLGYGPELNVTLDPYLVVRFDYDYYNDYSYATTKDQIRYDAHLHLDNYGAALDWHPFAGAFLVSVGLFKDNNYIDAVAVPQQSYVIDGQTFTASEVGTLNGHITFNSWAPYLGIGLNTLESQDRGVGFEIGAGVFYQGSPSVALSPSGPITTVPGLAQATQAEQQKLDDQWNSYKYYPVVNIGLVFRF
ncbi:MAG TPA: hypothetical protein VLV87_10295 [Gammaproteobacteria bacterium]|nr:hypothetical protein [Gammaproteobacteria bacterium]